MAGFSEKQIQWHGSVTYSKPSAQYEQDSHLIIITMSPRIRPEALGTHCCFHDHPFMLANFSPCTDLPFSTPASQCQDLPSKDCCHHPISATHSHHIQMLCLHTSEISTASTPCPDILPSQLTYSGSSIPTHLCLCL